MYKQEQINPYGKQGPKEKLVEEMFDNIAPTYDTLNHRLSWNIDRGWRRKAIRQLEAAHPQLMLDVATGTGDFAILAARMLQPRKIVGIDISEGMMRIAREKVEQASLATDIEMRKEDCLHMSFADNTFDAATAAFGIRNFQDLDRGLAEICRVLKPGGLLSIVELTTPVAFPMKQLFTIYSHTVLPVYGRLISQDSGAYSYLTASIEAFPQGEQMTGILRKAGFSEASFRRLTCGICTMYFAKK